MCYKTALCLISSGRVLQPPCAPSRTRLGLCGNLCLYVSSGGALLRTALPGGALLSAFPLAARKRRRRGALGGRARSVDILQLRPCDKVNLQALHLLACILNHLLGLLDRGVLQLVAQAAQRGDVGVELALVKLRESCVARDLGGGFLRGLGLGWNSFG